MCDFDSHITHTARGVLWVSLSLLSIPVVSCAMEGRRATTLIAAGAVALSVLAVCAARRRRRRDRLAWTRYHPDAVGDAGPVCPNHQAFVLLADDDSSAPCDDASGSGSGGCGSGGTPRAPLAASTLCIEPKLLRGGGCAAHLSLVVPCNTDAAKVESALSGMLQQSLDAAQCEGVYKVIVDVPPTSSIATLLRKCGFQEANLTMAVGLSDAAGRCAGRGPIASRSPDWCKSVPGVDGYVLRELSSADESEDYLALLRQLSQAPPIDGGVFLRQLERVRDSNGAHTIMVVTEAPPPGALAERKTPDGRRLLGCATILFEWLPVCPLARGDTSSQCHRRGALVARIEDVVVDSSTRGLGLGRALLRAVLDEARESGATCAMLNCSPANKAFYAKCGFACLPTGEVCFARYFAGRVPSHASMA